MKKAVFVTGAAVGTGLAIARKFASDGYAVFITSRDGEKADAAAQTIGREFGVTAKGYGLEIRDEEAVKAVFRDIDSRDCVVKTVVLNAANMGFYPQDPAAGQDFWTVPLEDFQEVFETNLVWNFMIIRQAALRMKEQGKGAIVFISSNTAYRAIPNRIAYSASKSGQLGMMRGMALDFGKYNIRVNAVLPGMIKTDRWEKNPDFYATVPSRYTPIGDVAVGADVADAVWYFAACARNTTGAELVVDGGNTIQLYPIIPKE